MRAVLSLLMVLTLVTPVAAGAAEDTAVVVKLAPGVAVADLPPDSEPLFGDWVRISGPAAAGLDAADPRFSVVQPDYPLELIEGTEAPADLAGFSAFAAPNDPLYGDQWHIPMVGGDVARDAATGDGVVVAVLDTGLTTDGSEDLGCIGFFKPYNAITSTEGVVAVGDTDGHGTGVAAVIAECTDNSLGVAGMAPDATVMPVKVLDDFGTTTASILAEGIAWAAANGADIINLSLGDPTCGAPCTQFPVVDAAIQAAVDADVLIVAASGNDGGGVAYPANHPAVLAVGAVGADGLIASYSSIGPEIDVVAPGGELPWPDIDRNGDGQPDGVLVESFDAIGWDYFYWDGTSFAAPIVSAVAAMVMELNPGAPAPVVRAALEDTATDKGAPGFDNTYGHGLVNAATAVSLGLVERLAGLDRYSTAVAVSQSEFDPGVPAAYIATGLDFPDALSAVPVAGLAGGPILLVPGTSIPGSVRSELTRLAPKSIVVLGGTAVVSAQVQAELAAYTSGAVTRIAGADRFATAAALSAASYGSADTVFVATGTSFPDALAGGPLGAVTGGPILLVGAVVPTATRQEILRLGPDEIVILGGSGVVSDAVAADLATMAPVRRVAGADRYTTAIAAAQEAFPGGPSTVFIATGLDYPDALSGGPAAVVSSAPIILVQAGAVPSSVRTYLNAVKPTRIVILGGPAAVTDAVAIELQAFLP